MQEDAAVPLMGIDPNTLKTYSYQVHPDEPSYPIINLFYKCRKFPGSLYNITLEDIQTIENTMRETFSDPLKMKKFNIYFHCLYNICNRIYDEKFPYMTELLELLLKSGTLCKKKLNQKHTTAHNILDHFISTIFANLSILTFSLGDVQKSEMYCRKQLEWLDAIKNLNPPDMAKRRFICKLVLAKIYFKFGYPDIMLSLIKEAYEIAEKFYYDEFDNFIDNLGQCSIT